MKTIGLTGHSVYRGSCVSACIWLSASLGREPWLGKLIFMVEFEGMLMPRLPPSDTDLDAMEADAPS